jgi:hypothetical protein
MKIKSYAAMFLASCLLLSSSASSESFSEKMKKAKEKLAATTDIIQNVDIKDAFSADVVEMSTTKITEYTEEVSKILPVLDKLGFSVSTFRMEIIPPSGNLRLVSRTAPTTLTTAEMKSLIGEYKGTLQRVILATAISAKAIQKMMELEVAVMDIKVGYGADIKVSYLKSIPTKEDGAATAFDDIDLLCGKAM